MRDPALLHSAIVERAMGTLVATLELHGNRPNEPHRAALRALVDTLAAMALGSLNGRYAVALPTSCGKTSAILSVLEALDHLGIAEECPLLVSGMRVEALREHVAKLVGMGVPRERLGLVYSYDPERDGREKPDDDPGERAFLLVTHARVGGGHHGLERCLRFRGRPRVAMFFDESFIRTDAVGLAMPELRRAVCDLQVVVKDDGGRSPRSREAVVEAAALLGMALELVTAELDSLKEDPDRAGIVELPPIPAERELRLRSALSDVKARDEALAFLGLLGADVRVVTTEQGGVVQFRKVVPDELDTVLVTDASYAVRTLTRLDPTLLDAESVLPAFSGLGFALAEVKGWRRVTFAQLLQGGGRSTLRAMFARPREDRWLCDEMIELVRCRPTDEAWAFVTYKQRRSEQRAMADILRRDLEAAGIDTAATVQVNGKERPRFSWLTWGTADASNAYGFVPNLVLVGIMHRDPVELHAAALGQMDLLGGSFTSAALRGLQRDELAHLAYQAASRGASRLVTDGVAGESRIWFVEKDRGVAKRLADVCPGATFVGWEVDLPSPRKVQAAAVAIRGALAKLEAEGVTRVAVKTLRQLAGLEASSKGTLTRAVSVVVAEASWVREGQSLVRATAGYFGFAVQQALAGDDGEASAD
jgi:hypothetical protein